MRSKKAILKKQKIKHSEKSRGSLLSIQIEDYEYWKEKIYLELIAKS